MTIHNESFDTALSQAKNQNFQFKLANQNAGKAGTVRTLLHYVEPVLLNQGCLEVLDRFIKNQELQAITVIDSNRQAVGIIDRSKISDIFLKPFSRDLLGKKQISELMDIDPIIVDIKASIDDVAQIIIDSGMRHMVNGFVIQENGRYAGMATGLSLLEEITHRKQRELFVLAHHDQLTGLPNRLLFKDRLLQACQHADRNNTLLALIFVDIDRFKFINDSMGHSSGDCLLQFFAERLSKNVRLSDTVARLGGDEFVIILQNIGNEKDVNFIVANILEHIRLPISLYDHSIQVTASMGGALYPQHGKSVDDLIYKADIAMYEVKQRGRDSFQMFMPGMENKTKERVSLEAQLRLAMAQGELSLCYQPQIDLQRGRMIGVEALLRWQHPALGYISPVTFIPIAEETGLIIQIGEWVLREAIQQHIHWIEQGLPSLRMAINISAVQFQHDGFLPLIKQIIEESHVDPTYLELELTESVVMIHAERAIEKLTALRVLGLKLAIDDFGTGYSSLNYLRKFPIDRIKIDQSFVRGIKNTPANEAIVKAIIALGESLGLETLAEGVENIEELECISSHHCMEAQGYHFAKALKADDLVAWFHANSDRH
ncbi:putative bifunctional diguanylate cyclase/phosphodiesterase [Methylomonas lenta]|uniref:putative bifunctional diguanylate cyclase/phosphodiesterase n=1 Tax=Methylomonas lenta TaxID=980561 RepID=UPI000ACC1636|nr:EAL domain-containing protein [Methylomonas lenta]